MDLQKENNLKIGLFMRNYLDMMAQRLDEGSRMLMEGDVYKI